MIHQIKIEQIGFHSVRTLSERQLQAMPAVAAIEWVQSICDEMCLQLTAYVMAMPSERIEIHRKFPADWWQALRRRWFPLWWLYRHPVRYERIDVSKQLYGAVCPHLHTDEKQTHIRFFTREANL